MKIFKKIALATFFGLLLCSCKQESPTQEYTVISGKLENASAGELIVRDREFKHVIPVNDDGTFTDALHVENASYYLIYGRSNTKVYLSKGSNVSFTANEKDFNNTLAFSGDYADLNNYYAEANKIAKFYHYNSRVYGEGEDAFVKAITVERKKLENKLEAVADIPADIKEKELRHLKYLNLKDQYMYEAIYHARHPGNEGYKASEEFMTYLSEIPLDRPEDYKYSAAYQYLIENVVVGNKAMKELQRNKEMESLQAVNKVALATIKNQPLLNIVIYDNYQTRLYRTNGKEEAYEDFMRISTDESHKEAITKLYNELTELKQGNPSPRFVDYENHAGGTTSLEDFKGKYVYIDIWATWCGPCKYEIPFLQKVEKQYHGKNIEFVSISVDEKQDHQKWKDMVAEEQMPGTQLFADNAFDSEFMQAYKVRALPHFILVDPQGNIVQTRAPSPSDEKLIELFETLEL